MGNIATDQYSQTSGCFIRPVSGIRTLLSVSQIRYVAADRPDASREVSGSAADARLRLAITGDREVGERVLQLIAIVG